MYFSDLFPLIIHITQRVLFIRWATHWRGIMEALIYIGDVLSKSLLSYQRFKPKDMTNRLELNSVNHSAFVDVSLLIFMKIYHIIKMIKLFSCCKLLFFFLLQQTSWLHIHRFRIQGVFWRICHLNNDEAITRCNHICREMPKSSKSIVFFHLN